MNLADLLGKTFECECGRTHTVPTEHFIYGADAIHRLPEIAAHYVVKPNYLILADTRTYEIAGCLVEAELKQAGASVNTLIVPDTNGESPVTDDTTFNDIQSHSPAVDGYIAVGSGVINDLTKWVAYERQKPFFTVPTAASMNGYASANVSATINDLKMLFLAQACKGVFAVPEIIEKAPFELTTSGLGDVVAKSVSSADWKLNQFLFGEYYCQFSVDLLKDLEPVYLNHPQKIKSRDATAMRALLEALFYSSVAMTITGTSSPASGGEHLFSHTLDMISASKGTKHDLHGRQVGVGTILSAALYERVLAMNTPVFKEFSDAINEDFWGLLRDIIQPEYSKKQEKYESAARSLSKPETWNQLRSSLRPNLLPAQRIKACLKQAGAGHRVQDIRIDDQSIDSETLKQMWVHAHQMRSRFTILDLAVMLGIMPDMADQILNEWID